MTGAALDRIARSIAKRVENAPVRVLSDDGAYPRPPQIIPTDLQGLDEALGIGGWPLGTLVELYGAESVGKTTLSKVLAARFQAAGVTPYLGDLEHSGFLQFDQDIGLNLDDALGSQPSSGEEAFLTIIALAQAFAKAKRAGFFVLDSLAGAVPIGDLETPLDENARPGSQANLLKRAIPQMLNAIKSQPIGLLVINQVRENIGGGPYAPKYRTPGGMALKHFAHMRIEMARIGQIRKGDDVVGIRSRIKVVKSKLAPPYRECAIEIHFRPFRVVEFSKNLRPE
jgi:recombination protein RecA